MDSQQSKYYLNNTYWPASRNKALGPRQLDWGLMPGSFYYSPSYTWSSLYLLTRCLTPWVLSLYLLLKPHTPLWNKNCQMIDFVSHICTFIIRLRFSSLFWFLGGFHQLFLFTICFSTLSTSLLLKAFPSDPSFPITHSTMYKY